MASRIYAPCLLLLNITTYSKGDPIALSATKWIKMRTKKKEGNISRDLRMIVGWISALKNTVRPSLQSLHLSPLGPLTLFFPLLPYKQPQQ
jgi:hypothetical protein